MTTIPNLVKPETQVNTTDGGTDQVSAAITPLQDGGYVVVWRDDSRTYNTAGEAIVGQRFDSAGNKVGGDPAHGGEVMLSQFPNSGDQFAPAVTTLANGNIAVAFVDSFAGDKDIWVRIFDPSLHEVRRDAIDLGTNQTVDPSLTALADGSYVVSYTVGDFSHTDVVGRIVSAAGVVGNQFNLENPPTSTEPQGESHLATLSNGNVVAVYGDTFPLNPDDNDIRFSIFTPDGRPVLDHITVDGAATGAREIEPAVAALNGGGFVVTWTVPDGDHAGIHATITDNDSGTVARDLMVNTTNTGPQVDSDVVALGDGGFLVTWEDGMHQATHGQRFDALGDKIGAEFTLDTGGGPDHRDAALLSDGRVAFAFDAFAGNVGDFDVNTSLFTIGVADAHVHDLNGDGSGDLIWRNDNGLTGIWEIRDGAPIAAASVGTATPDWHFAATGDFNGDGKSDILWNNDNGAVGLWELNGSQIVGASTLGLVGPDWHIATTGDFNGDGKSDILWHNDNGAVGIWELNGTQITSGAVVGTVGPDWHIADTGDFNGDGKSDILWRNDNGAVGLWELDGSQIIGGGVVGTAGPDWHIARSGDFNGDGHSDILWRNDNGAVGIWDLDGTNVIGTAALGSLGPDWHIADTGDFNRDGKSDIVWRNDSGATTIWEVDGGHVIGTPSLGAAGTDWHLLA